MTTDTEYDSIKIKGRDYPARVLPTGLWAMLTDDTWTKVCGVCGGTGYRPEYAGVYNGECFYCNKTGRAAGVKTRTTKALDAKARADERRAAKQAEEREARAAIALAAYAVELAAEVNKAHEEALALNAKIDAAQYLDAAEGDKVTVTGTVTTARTFEADAYQSWQGTVVKRVIVVDCGDGVTVVTYTQAAWAFEVEEGQTVTLAATVKGHRTDRNGVPQTLLTRPRLSK